MLSLVSPILLVLVVAVNSFDKSWHRVKCGLSVLVPTVIHLSIFHKYPEYINSVEYYLSAMAFNAMAIGLLEFIKRGTATRLIVHLQLLSFAFMLSNLAGAMIWYAYLTLDWYNSLCVVLSIAEVVRIFIHTNGDKKDGIDSRGTGWSSDANKRGLGDRS